jgi:diketogulonate reductase-like aldo/keto reductase
MHTIDFGRAGTWPPLGLGTWRMGESARSRSAEVAAIRQAIEIGYRVIDTAEMYGEGGAESVVGEALAQALRAGAVARDALCIVSKVYPHNASRAGTPAACDRSRKRLGLDRIDLYLLHWPGSHPLAETVAAFEALQSSGRIGAWGVSNFDIDCMARLQRAAGGMACSTNQVFYALNERGIEFDLLPWMQARAMPLMAYCPLGQGELARDPGLQAVAREVGASAAQLALAWLLARPGVMAIPKAAGEHHLRENFAAATLAVPAGTLAQLDRLFAPPSSPQALAVV